MFSNRSLSLAAFGAFLFASVPAHSQSTDQCFPIEAGGTGVNYKVTSHSDGSVYTWHCFSQAGVARGVWLAADSASKPTNPKEAKDLKIELTRLSVLQGHSRDGRVGFEGRAQAQLSETAPKSYVTTPSPVAK